MNIRDARSIASLFGRIIVLTVLLVICFALGSHLSGISSQPEGSIPSSVDPSDILRALLISSSLEVLVLTLIILRSRWAGWQLTCAVFLAFYGSMTVIAQIESIVYLQIQLPPGLVLKLFIAGAITAGLFTPISVMMLGRMRRPTSADDINARLVMPWNEWMWKLGAIAVVYLFLYYFFGYYVAWQNPAVLEYYGGSDPGTFFSQIGRVFDSTPWMFPLQAFRSLFWVALVLPMVRSLKGNSWQVALMLALFFSVWSAQLLLPNPYMPREVAQAHLVETSLSNFLFGLFTGWLLSRHHSSFKDLFAR